MVESFRRLEGAVLVKSANSLSTGSEKERRKQEWQGTGVYHLQSESEA